MAFTDSLYSAERGQFELALRMIGHEARTGTISECTGLSDDRIRKLYARYFCGRGGTAVKRRRGKSPQQIGRYVKTPKNRLEATTLVALYLANLLLRIDTENRVRPCWPRPDVEYGLRLCRAYETYLLLHPEPSLSFEWAASLLKHISRNDELILTTCETCSAPYIHDAYALDTGLCPGCGLGGTAPALKPRLLHP